MTEIRIYIDYFDVLPSLTDAQKGELLQAIVDETKGIDVKLTGLMTAIFVPFKNHIARKKESYAKTCEKNKKNGLSGGRPITQNNPLGLSGLTDNPTEPNVTQNNPPYLNINTNRNIDINTNKEREAHTPDDSIFESISNATKPEWAVRQREEIKKELTAESDLPTLEKVLEFFSRNKYPEKMAKEFFYYYDATGWINKHGHPIKRWHSLAQSWASKESSFKNGSPIPPEQKVILKMSKNQKTITNQLNKNQYATQI